MTDSTEPNLGPQRCGTVAIVGKPNVGKSTLLNALVGQKISITSRKAQTTRHRITGIHNADNTQFIFVDTPGFQTAHANALNRSLNKTVLGAVGDVDLVLFVVNAGSFADADAKVLRLLSKNIPCILVANKLDKVNQRHEIAQWLQEMHGRRLRLQPRPKLLAAPALSPDHAASARMPTLEPQTREKESWSCTCSSAFAVARLDTFSCTASSSAYEHLAISSVRNSIAEEFACGEQIKTFTAP
jgi:small GTP-binding protein